MQEPIFEITLFDPKTKNIRARLHPSTRAQPKPWSWPLARVGNRDPIVLAEHVGDDRRGVDLGYVVAPFDSQLYVPVHAAQAGEVAFAHEGKDGCAVSIDHGGEFTTHYAHMSMMFVTPCLGRRRRRQYVPAGDVIGYAAKAPLHVRSELWKWTDDRGFVAVDPVTYLKTWALMPQGSGRLRPDTNPTNEAA